MKKAQAAEGYIGQNQKVQPVIIKKNQFSKASSKPGNGTDYTRYSFSLREAVIYTAEGCVLMALLNFLFYKSLAAFIFLLPVPFLFLKYAKRLCRQKRLKLISREFREALNSLSVSMQAGHSAEQAFFETGQDLRNILGNDAPLTREFNRINSQIKVSVPVETLLFDLAERTELEDIENFATVFASAKRTGGNMTEIIRSSARTIGEKIDVEREIETTLAAKKYEQKILSVMPCAIILYMQLSSPGFLDVLYNTAFGAIVMTLCLAVYAGAFYLSGKIVNIEV